MRVAIIGSRGIHSSHGGIEKCLAQLCPRLAALGHEVEVFGAVIDPEAHVTPGVRSVKVPAWTGKYTETLTRTLLATLFVILNPRRFDVVNFVAVGPGLFSFLPRLFGMPVVVSIHGLDWKRAKWPALAQKALRFAEICLVRMATEITVVSRELQRYFNLNHGRDAVFAPNGLMTPSNADRPEHLAQLGLEQGRYILFASRLVPEKGAHELIAAFNRVNTDMRLAIVGGGVYDQDYVASLRQLDSTGRCVFTGHLSGDALAAAFLGAYLYVLPSHIEGMSLSLLEALAFGKPVLVSDIAENLEVVGDCGFTYPVGNVGALARKLSELIVAPEKLACMAQRFKLNGPGVFDWDATALRYHEVFTRVAKISKPTRIDVPTRSSTSGVS